MSKVLVTEAHLEAIADAIRARNGSEAAYRPGDMAAAVAAIRPALRSLEVSQNGVYLPEGAEGFDRVTVAVSGAGGGDWPVLDEIAAGGTDFTASVAGSVPLVVDDLPANVKRFYQDYARAPRPTAMDVQIALSAADAGRTLNQLLAAHPASLALEYYGCVYGNSAMIADLGLVLLADASPGASSVVLADDIGGYSGVILQGIYNRQRGSGYNTSMLYVAPAAGAPLWAGMKDRNSNYDCFVTFDGTDGAAMTGNQQVMIYGIP